MEVKSKILRINAYSILLLLFLFAIATFISINILLKKSYNNEIKNIKKEYLSSQKTIIKNEVNNFINFIEHTEKIVQKEELNNIKNNVLSLKQLLKIVKPQQLPKFLKIIKERNPMFHFGLTDLDGNLIYSTDSEFKKADRISVMQNGFQKIVKHKTRKGIKYSYLALFQNQFNKKTYIIGSAIYQNEIDKKIKSIVIDRVYGIKFGAKNNGYLSIAEILNYKGGKKFAKVIALPVKPEWVGKFLDDSKKDAKGKMYRKLYLKIANSSGEGFVSYWFFKKKTKELRPKLSYVKLYKKFNWLIFTSVYIDDIDKIIANKQQIIKKELSNIFFIWVIFSIIFLLIAYLLAMLENRVLQKMIDEYEKLINLKNYELEKINKNLEQEVQEKTEKLLNSILIDPLTNLPNREKLLLDIENKKVFIAVLNIDSFKEINDFYGIKTGDIVLQKISKLLENLVNQALYKLPSDEFAIISDNCEYLEKSIDNFIYILANTSLKINEDTNITISVSAGIGNSLTKADMALKYAKRHKTKLVVFNENLNILKEYENNLKWKKIIHEAIKSDNIIPFVQPLINNQTGKIDKYECLVRLKADKIYSPFFFLEISKHTNQYYDIQKIMVEKCFKVFSKLKYKFSINLSTIDLSNTAFKEFLIEKIDEYQVANRLIIELLEDEELLKKEILEFLHFLKGKGVLIAIDDFGSGYSNFSYLVKDIPLNILKIDGSLVKNIAQNEKDYRLFKTIVNMANEFQFEIVAEFVENKEIHQILIKEKVQYSQGYLFSEPFKIEKLLEGEIK